MTEDGGDLSFEFATAGEGEAKDEAAEIAAEEDGVVALDMEKGLSVAMYNSLGGLGAGKAAFNSSPRKYMR